MSRSQTPSQPQSCVCGGETSVQLPPIVGSRPSFVPSVNTDLGSEEAPSPGICFNKRPFGKLEGAGGWVTGTGSVKVASISGSVFNFFHVYIKNKEQVSKTLET